MLEYIALGIVVLNTLATVWNLWEQQSIKLAITELQLNLRREFNGRYLEIQRFEDFVTYLRDLREPK
jgi:hypothetical protein